MRQYLGHAHSPLLFVTYLGLSWFRLLESKKLRYLHSRWLSDCLRVAFISLGLPLLNLIEGLLDWDLKSWLSDGVQCLRRTPEWGAPFLARLVAPRGSSAGACTHVHTSTQTYTHTH